MEKIKVEICCGTACYLLGAAKLMNIEEELPENLKDKVDIEKNVLVMGVGTHAEIWAQEVFEDKSKRVDMNKIKELMMELGF